MNKALWTVILIIFIACNSDKNYVKQITEDSLSTTINPPLKVSGTTDHQPLEQNNRAKSVQKK
jgi:hypothetical protein